MAFTIFQKNNIIDASEINNNFYHIATGNLLPRGGASLASSDFTYDLGSALYKWNNVHLQNLYLVGSQSVSNTWNLISEITLSASAASVEFSGLINDYKYYMINASIFTNSINSLHLNNDSATNYNYQYIYSSSTVLATSVQTATTAFLNLPMVGAITGNNQIEILLYSIFNDFKLAIYSGFYGISSTVITGIFKGKSFWGNNTDTLTSIKFNNQMLVNTNIQLWAKR